MRKWLMITMLVLSGFVAILLGLGYLLNENEKSTAALKKQLEEASQAETIRRERTRERKTIANGMQQPVEVSKSKSITNITDGIRVVKQFEQIVVRNLTCISVQQCQVIKVNFKNIDCSVAINNIGASLLKKLKTQYTTLATCPKSSPQVLLSCQQNICAFQQ